MPRPKGSKNKSRRKRRDSYMVAMYKVLPPKSVEILLKLAQKSNIDIRRVHDDAVLEGAAELESEAYASLIEFNTRRGKVVHEREPEKVDQESVDSASSENDDPGPDNERSIDAAFRSGLESETDPASGVAENIEPEPREHEPREIPF